MKDRYSVKAKTVLRCLKNPGLAAGAALLALATSGAHAYDGYHELMVKSHSNWKSMYIVFTDDNGYGRTKCRPVAEVKWRAIGFVTNGTNVTVQPFSSSSDCTSGSIGKKTKKVPGNDGLDKFWFTY